MTPTSAERGLRPIVLVTGGSRGIGLALAHGFAARGHDLVLVARDAERLQRVAAAIAAAHGVAVEPIACDLAAPHAAADLVAAIGAKGRRVDILVNCAGVGTSGAFTSNTPGQIHAALRLNIDAATALMRACLPGMVAQGRGGVLNVASLAGMQPMPYLAIYGATKAYLVALSRAAAWEVAGTGVTVSVLLPGPVDTGFFTHDGQPGEEHTGLGLLPGLSAEAVARTAIEGFLARQTVITPGMLAWLCRLGMKLLPRRVPIAFVRFILSGAKGDPTLASTPRTRPPIPSQAGPLRALGASAHIVLLACIAVVFALQIGIASRKAPHVDTGPGSVIAAAASLLEHGTFADAVVSGGAGQPQPGRYLAPGYPAFVAGLALLDPNLADAIRCLAASRTDCMQGNPFRTLAALQGLLMVVALALLFCVARLLSGSVEIAGLAILLTFVMGRFNDFALSISQYAMVPPVALIFGATLFIAHRRRSILVSAIAGLLLGFLALLDAYYAALIPLAPVLLVCAESSRVEPRRQWAATAAVTLILGACVVLGPWIVRNYLQFGDFALTQGSETKNLAERMAYSGLTPREWRVALFFWLPGIGDISSLLLPVETTRKFDVYYTGSLLLESERVLAATPAIAGESRFRRLLDVYAFGRPADYAVTSALLLERGLRSTGGFLVLWGWLALPLLLRRLKAQRALAPFLLIAGPLFAIAAVQSLLTANLPWMNVPLVFVYGYAIASVTGGLELPFGLRRLFGRRDSAVPFHQ